MLTQKQKRTTFFHSNKSHFCPFSVFDFHYFLLYLSFMSNHKDLWIHVLETLSKQLDWAKLITWFKDTAILEVKEETLVVGLPFPLFLNTHLKDYAHMTLEAAQSLDSNLQRIEYEVDMNLQKGDPRVIDLIAHFPKKTESRKLPKKNQVKTKKGIISNTINKRYTLGNFLTSPENRLAHAACQNVATYPGETYNPLFIYGKVGMGKTHLLQGVANEMQKNDPNALVAYMTSEMFVNEVIRAIQTKSMEAFRNKYRKVDAFIIDDIQFLANKERTQEEFFHTFNTLHDLGSQIILSSDRPPQELRLLSERLVSRFESGMIVDVKMPDFETRLAILQQKAQQAQVFVNEEVLKFIAHNVTHSVRALEGVMKQAIALYELEHTAPTVQSVSKLIKTHQKETDLKYVGPQELTPKPSESAVTLDKLIDSATNYYMINRKDLTGQSRRREFIVPRQLVMYLANKKLRFSLSKIGETLGRNHTTVMHAVRRIGEELRNNRQLLRDMNAITQEVGIY